MLMVLVLFQDLRFLISQLNLKRLKEEYKNGLCNLSLLMLAIATMTATLLKGLLDEMEPLILGNELNTVPSILSVEAGISTKNLGLSGTM